ncbi:MAG: hypothetical protein Fur0035_02310 [Anaerolineales bacterium]
MPVYAYRCDNCGVRFERRQSFDEQSLTTCPECKKKSLKKVYAPVGVVFKGSGWYATDHRSPSGANRAPKAETPAASGDSAAPASAPAAAPSAESKKD